MKLTGAGAATAVAVATAVVASAASLGGVVARQLGAGTASVGSCDSDGVSLSYTVSGGTVQSVSVSGVAGACLNGAIKVTLANSSGASIGAGGPVTVVGSSASLTLSPQPTAASVAAAHVSIAGP